MDNRVKITQKILATNTPYYVSQSGNDTNPGTLAKPWKTLKKAVSMATPGDTIFILPGIYYEKLTPNSGSSGNYITYTATPGTVILDGTGSGGSIIQIVGKNYLKIQNLTVKNSPLNGVDIQPSSSGVKSSYIEILNLNVQNSKEVGIRAVKSQNIVIKNNTINYVKYSSGIGVWTSDQVLVDHNTIVNAHVEPESNGGHEESLTIASTTNFEVSNNDISMNGQKGYLGNEGIDIKEASQNGKVHHNYIHDYSGNGGGLYVDAWKAVSPSLKNIDIYANRLSNTANGIIIGSEQGGTAENINVYNNIVYNTGSVGIGIPGRLGDGIRRNINIFNNTIYKAQYNGGAGIYITAFKISNIAIKNNIVYFNNTNGQITVASKSLLAYIQADHNLVFGPKLCSLAYPNCVEVSNNPSGFPNIHNNYTADPKFVSLTLPDLSLQPTSPARDKGVDLRPLVGKDYLGVDRPQMNVFDIGAFEFVSSPPTQTVNILKNPSFESGNSSWFSPWWLDVSHGTAATLNKDTSVFTDGLTSARINVTKPSSTIWYTQFFQDNLTINANTSYKISFWAKSQVNKSIQVIIQKVKSPYTQYLNKTIKLSTSWQKYDLTFNSTVSDSNVKLAFLLSEYSGSTWFDNFSFTEINL